MIKLATVTLSFLLAGCAGVKTLDDYDTAKEPANRIITDSGCFNIWKHPEGDRSLVVRQCEGDKFGHAIGEGILMGLSFGLIRTDVGATPKEFIHAAKNSLDSGCFIINSQRLDDGMGGTLAYEMMYECGK